MEIGPVTAPAGPTDAAYHYCGAESHRCWTGLGLSIAFGAGVGAQGRYVYKTVTQRDTQYIDCTSAWFDGQDPAPGVRKACFAKAP